MPAGLPQPSIPVIRGFRTDPRNLTRPGMNHWTANRAGYALIPG